MPNHLTPDLDIPPPPEPASDREAMLARARAAAAACRAAAHMARIAGEYGLASSLGCSSSSIEAEITDSIRRRP